MVLADYFVMAAATALVGMHLKNSYAGGDVDYVRSALDGARYLVQNLPDKRAAADLLAHVNRDSVRLIKHMVASRPADPDVQRLYKNYDPAAISEGTPHAAYAVTSYSVNKGERIVVCIRQKDERQSLVDRNTVMYVAIHELAHLMTKEVGHTPAFWDNFRVLLAEAEKLGIYESVDYAASPQDYCGISITSNVLINKP